MSNPYVDGLVDKHRRNGVVLDAQLLLVYLVGLCDPRLVERFSRTANYTTRDFLFLSTLLGEFSKVITTPGILTEVSNLAGKLKDQLRLVFCEVFRETIAVLEEQHIPSQRVCEHVHFPKCGLTDAAVLTIARQGLLVLTDDFELFGLLTSSEIDCLNYRHIRPLPR